MQDSISRSETTALKDYSIVQVDPHEALVASLKREVQLLRAENAYFRNQVLSSVINKCLKLYLLLARSPIFRVPHSHRVTFSSHDFHSLHCLLMLASSLACCSPWP